MAQEVDEFPVLVAPPVLCGFTHYNIGHVGTINLQLETFIAVLCDVCRSLKANGFERIVVVNGHGGNVAPQRAASVKLAEVDVWALPIVYWEMARNEWPRPEYAFSPEVAAFASFPERRREAPLGVMGDPFAASAEKGERLIGLLKQRLAQACRELRAQPLRHYRQFGSHCP